MKYKVEVTKATAYGGTFVFENDNEGRGFTLEQARAKQDEYARRRSTICATIYEMEA